jgi:apolipoprotein D and lipocalin family protein
LPDSNNAKLKISFFGPFYMGDYWVLDHADDYTWSIVGEPGGRYLWILTREAKPSSQQRTVLIERARKLGYNVTLLRETLH